MGHPLGRLALLHPFPSALNALLVATLATIAGAALSTAVTLAAAMAAFQVSIGALNDLVDAPEDALVKPGKPLPSGLVSARSARVVVVAGAAIGLALSALVSPSALAIGAAGYGCGVAYDLGLKRRGLGWVAFSAALPLLLLYGWVGAGAGLPPGAVLLLPLAAVAGTALHLANALTDLDHDLATGGVGLAVRLGRTGAVVVLAILSALVYLLAWLILGSIAADPGSLTVAAVATALGIAGVAGTAVGTPRSTAYGWSLQALAMAGLATAWVLAASP